MLSEKIAISVIVMTKNEERNIRKCLMSLQHFSEVFVVDSISDDRTCEIATEMGAKVIPFRWDGRYPKKKQWCLENLPFSYEWVMYVDADEELYPQLVNELREMMLREIEKVGFFVGFDYVFLGRILRYGHRVYKLVLFKRDKGRFLDYDDLDAKNMWEVEGHYQPEVDGEVGILRNKILHNDHDDLYHFFVKLNKYSDWEAALRVKNRLRIKGQATINGRRFLQYIGDRLPL